MSVATPPIAAAPVSAHRLMVNGAQVEVIAPGGRRLLDVLRRDLGLTGTKEGCGEGECGACSVLLDGELVASCLVPIAQAAGREVLTVEGLGVEAVTGGSGGTSAAAPAIGPTAPRLDPLQAAFLDAGAVQCGMCTPGMLLAARAFLASGEAPTDEAIRAAIAGNLCRCTGYTKIIDAIRAVAGHGNDPSGGSRPPAPPPSSRRALPGPVIAPTGAPDVVVPRSLDDALRLVAEGCRPIAGGTDLLVSLAVGLPAAGQPFVDLGRLAELRAIRRDADTLVVGALATYTDLVRSEAVAAALPVLAEAAASVGAPQIRNRGTIGGNIATASPAGDLLPVLLATDAGLVLRSLRGERVVPAARFFTGYRRTARKPDELLTAVRFPIVASRLVRFRKVGTRRAQAISKVAIAVAWRPEAATSAWTEVRVAYGSVAEVPLRARRAEAVLEGSVPSVELAERAAAAAEADVRPIDDVRSTAVYRRAVSGRILRRIVLDAVVAIGADSTR